MPGHNRYVVISPAKDEATHIERTLKSVVGQTVLPVHWIIVDDGSQDATAEIVRGYEKTHDWIQLLKIDRDAVRRLGSAEIRAFAAGFELVKDIEFDFVVKLDCDLELPADYFELLLAKFDADERLGIASGVFSEPAGNGWIEKEQPAYHAVGACKVVRFACYQQIGGFPMFPGWDTADEIKAQFRGWKTRHFKDVKFYHLRREGAASGGLRTNKLHGEVYYACGGGLLFFGFKVLHRMWSGQPRVLGGLAMVWGYLKPRLTSKDRIVDDSEAKFYQNLLKKRIMDALSRNLLHRDSPSPDGLAT